MYEGYSEIIIIIITLIFYFSHVKDKMTNEKMIKRYLEYNTLVLLSHSLSMKKSHLFL